MVEGGLGLGNGGNAQDIHVEAIRLHPQTHVDAGASGLTHKIDHVGAHDVRVSLEDAHRRQSRRVTIQGADTPVGRIQVARPRAARPRQPGDTQNPIAALHVLDRRVRHGDVHPRRVQDEAVQLTRTRVTSLHGEGQRQASTRRVAEDNDAAELSLGLVDDGLDEVESFGRGVLGGERVVGNDDGQARAVDKALDDAPLAHDHRVHVRSAMQIDECTARTQAPLRKHAGNAIFARRGETRTHASRHRMRLRGVERHLLSCRLAVEQRRHKTHTEVNNAHLEGHGASFVSTNQSVRAGTHPRANMYQDTLRGRFPASRTGSSLLHRARVKRQPQGHSLSSAPKPRRLCFPQEYETLLSQDRHEYIGRYLVPRPGVSRAYSAHWK